MKQLFTFGNYQQICCHSISNLSIVSLLSLSWCLLLLSEDSMVGFFGRRPLFPRQLYNCFGSGPDATGCRGIIDVKKKHVWNEEICMQPYGPVHIRVQWNCGVAFAMFFKDN